MKPFLLVAALVTAGCSGWVQHQQFAVLPPAAAVESDTVFRSTGYRLVKLREETADYVSERTFRRLRSPELIVTTYADGSAMLSFWDSGVPPFAWYSPGFDAAISSVFGALQKNGIARDQIRQTTVVRAPQRYSLP